MFLAASINHKCSNDIPLPLLLEDLVMEFPCVFVWNVLYRILCISESIGFFRNLNLIQIYVWRIPSSGHLQHKSIGLGPYGIGNASQEVSMFFSQASALLCFKQQTPLEMWQDTIVGIAGQDQSSVHLVQYPFYNTGPLQQLWRNKPCSRFLWETLPQGKTSSCLLVLKGWFMP